MMERNFYSDDFEQLIREKTEQYKMYPSEKVWKGVYSSLHTKKRWFFAGMSILVTGIILVAGKELIAPASHTAAAKKPSLTATLSNSKTTPENSVLPAAFSEYKPGSHSTLGHNGQGSGLFADDDQQVSDEIGELSIVDPETGQRSDRANTVSRNVDIADIYVLAANLSSERPDVHVDVAAIHTNAIPPVGGLPGNRMADAYAKYLARLRTGNVLTGSDPAAGEININIYPDLFPGNLTAGLQIPLHPSAASRSMARMHAAEQAETTVAADAVSIAPDSTTVMQRINWLQEYAVYNLNPSSRKNSDLLQFYLSPTATFRTVTGSPYQNPKSNSGSAPAPLTGSMDMRDYLNRAPALGFEAGMSLVHKIARNLSFKMGLQFSYSSFAIQAFAVNPGPVTVVGSTDSSASFRSMNSSKSMQEQDLHNEYFQLSAPIGLQLKVLGNERLQLNIALTAQPTYFLNTNSYLLTTDYSNYTKDPTQFRRWNLNGGIEAFVSYKVNKNWSLQAGPEFRYQLLSSYYSQYPIRENLQQYGLKIGFTKSLP
jgi:hypothetical protein